MTIATNRMERCRGDLVMADFAARPLGKRDALIHCCARLSAVALAERHPPPGSTGHLPREAGGFAASTGSHRLSEAIPCPA
jgi:hypothetical protein